MHGVEIGAAGFQRQKVWAGVARTVFPEDIMTLEMGHEVGMNIAFLRYRRMALTKPGNFP